MDKQVFLFPLSQSLLLKKVIVPFHIFEPRYRQMIQDSLQLKIPIAIVPSQTSSNYQGTICVAGFPHILHTYTDGRMDIFITGSIKCLLTHFVKEDPYKVYGHEPLSEVMKISKHLEFDLENLKQLLQNWATQHLSQPEQRETFVQTLSDHEMLVNYCTVFLVSDYETKLKIMEAETLNRKIEALLNAVGPKEITLGPFLPTLRF